MSNAQQLHDRIDAILTAGAGDLQTFVWIGDEGEDARYITGSLDPSEAALIINQLVEQFEFTNEHMQKILAVSGS